MTELQIELQEAIKKIVSISERVKENPELGENLTYLMLAIEPSGEGLTATLGASKREVIQMFVALMEQDENFREYIMIASALTRMKSTIIGAMGGDFMEFIKQVMSEGKEGSKSEEKEGSEGDDTAV